MWSESQWIIFLLFEGFGNFQFWTKKTKSSSLSFLSKGRDNKEKIIPERRTGKTETRTAVEKYLKAPIWKTIKVKKSFKGQSTLRGLEAIQPPSCICPKIIDRKPKTATPRKLISKRDINADFIGSILTKEKQKFK